MTDSSTSTPSFFGTDGIRGPFGRAPLDERTVVTLGRMLGRLLQQRHHQPVVALGGDTRDSTPTLCQWLARGLDAEGVRQRYLGVVPTPAMAWLAAQNDAIVAAIAVSASHNPHPDNGIKVLDGEGFKWSPEAEAELEQLLLANRDGELPEETIELEVDHDAVDAYLEALRASIGDTPLNGLRIALDTGNGAASAFAQELFESLGAAVEIIHASPDGCNINRDCGSTHPSEVARLTVERGCDLGFAFDGDADRAILIDEQGNVRDGDAMLYLWARHLQQAGELQPPGIVATSMSNLGLQRALADHGVELVRCDVGDRQVMEALQREDLRLGGEQSGHLVDLHLSTTGDGLLTALQIAAIRARAGKPISELVAHFRRYPQILLNVPVSSKPDLDSLPAVMEGAQRVRQDLADDGRLVLRYSGTEPLARIMIEGPEQGRIDRLARDLAQVIEAEIG